MIIPYSRVDTFSPAVAAAVAASAPLLGAIASFFAIGAAVTTVLRPQPPRSALDCSPAGAAAKAQVCTSHHRNYCAEYIQSYWGWMRALVAVFL